MKDTFEIAFNDYLNGITDEVLQIYVNGEFSEEMPVSYFFREYDEMPQIEQIALKHCKGKILDIGAGAGCHSLILQKQGYNVTSLEIKKGLVEIMKKRGVKKPVHSNIYDYHAGPFDTLFIMMNGIGFTKDFKGLERFLKHAAELLHEDGQILLDSSETFQYYEDENGLINLPAGHYYGEFEYRADYKNISGKPFKWLFIDYSNLEYIARQSGYKCELLFINDNHYLVKLYRSHS